LCLAGELLAPSAENEADYLTVQALTAPLPDDKGKDRDKRQPWEQPALLPLRVILRDFVTSPYFPQSEAAAGAETLWQFIESDLGNLQEFGPDLKNLVSQQPALLLLDGLDEVPEAGERRQRLKAVIIDFKASYPHTRILVTSRIYAYQQDQGWQLPGFVVATLSPFSRGQITRFVERWYAQTAALGRRTEDDALGRAELLKREIYRNPRLYELAESPLLLTLMASLHDWRSGSLPEEREKLYEAAVELLLENWEQRKIKRDSRGKFEKLLEPSLSEYLQVSKKVIRGYLELLAFEAHRDQADGQSGQTADILQKKLIDGLLGLSDKPDLRPRLLAHYLSRRAGLLPERRVGIHTFPHRTFQEYLAACYLNRDCYPDKVADLARTEPNRWREVTLLAGLRAAVTTESPLWDLADALCQNDASIGDPTATEMADLWGAHLAAQGLVEAGTVTIPPAQKRYGQRLKRIKGWLATILAYADLPATERAAAGKTLARLGDERGGVGLRADGLPDMAWCAVPAGPFLYGDNKKPRELPAFRLGRYPVTNAQYHAFVRAGGYRNPAYWRAAEAAGVWRAGRVKRRGEDKEADRPYDYGTPFNLANHPVVGLTWYEALAFCGWLTEQYRQVGDLGADFEITLPTEQQWEKAARGPEGFEYPWGAEPDPNKANYDDTQLGATSAVGCFSGGRSPYGCEEMSGNVWEWCRTKYDAPEDNGLDGGTNVPRVLRGGAFSGIEWFVRGAFRSRNLPGNWYYHFGFRVCVSPLL